MLEAEILSHGVPCSRWRAAGERIALGVLVPKIAPAAFWAAGFLVILTLTKEPEHTNSTCCMLTITIYMCPLESYRFTSVSVSILPYLYRAVSSVVSHDSTHPPTFHFSPPFITLVFPVFFTPLRAHFVARAHSSPCCSYVSSNGSDFSTQP